MGGMPWRVAVASVSAGPRYGILRLGESADLLERQRIATEAAALAVVNDHGIPAPELLASDPDGSLADQPALLVSVCPGTSRIPKVSSVVRLERLRPVPQRSMALSSKPPSSYQSANDRSRFWTSAPVATLQHPRHS